jgi:integrase
MKYSLSVYKRNRNGKVFYDGMLRYYDEDGKRRTIHRERPTKSAARDDIQLELDKLQERGPKALQTKVTTFEHLAVHCETKIYVEAEFNAAGERLEGVRCASTYKAHIKHFRAFFKQTKIKDILVADLTQYRAYRLRSTRRGPNDTRVNIQPGTVARELTTLRAMLNEAVRNGWIKHSPFEFARKNEVFRSSDRKKRSLILSFEDEIKLIEACQTEDRRHLRALIIVALDTGARFGELIHLKKSQINFAGVGWIIGLLNYKDNGGDRQVRDAAMTTRVREALLDIMNKPAKKAFKVMRGKKPSEDLVFGITSNVRTAWEGALEDAGLTHLGLHFHDLRHVPGTRVQDLLGLPTISKALGHKDPKTTAQIYINQEQRHLTNFSTAVEQAQQAGYALAKEKKVTTDQESTLIS